MCVARGLRLGVNSCVPPRHSFPRAPPGKTKSIPGGRSGGGGAVPWNIQNVNTNPANFLWEKDRPSVTCVAPGLYEVG